MKHCPHCKTFHHQEALNCQQCLVPLVEIDFCHALKLTERHAFKNRIGGKGQHKLPDAYKQYHIRCYLKNRSLFLDFDLYKNRLKHGRRLKRFFIAPINVTSVINLPWFVFNIISSNLFHLQHTEYCKRCESKYIPGMHDQHECDYNIEYFNILDDILSGHILERKALYEHYADENSRQGLKSAYNTLFRRKVRGEIFWDFLSISLTIFFWIYIAIHISYPLFQVLIQKMQDIDSYEFTILTLR